MATVGSIFAVALGVLCGTQLVTWAEATGRVVEGVSGTVPSGSANWATWHVSVSTASFEVLTERIASRNERPTTPKRVMINNPMPCEHRRLTRA